MTSTVGQNHEAHKRRLERKLIADEINMCVKIHLFAKINHRFVEIKSVDHSSKLSVVMKQKQVPY